MKLLGLLVATFSMIAPSVARADVAADLKDIGARRLPVRHAWLGWSGRTAHVRTIVCQDDPSVSCFARLASDSDDASSSVTLLSKDVDDCETTPCRSWLSAAEARAFTERDGRALAALPPLTPGAPVADPANVFGTVAGEATKIDFELVPRASDAATVAMVLRGKGGVKERLGVVGDAYTLTQHRIDEVRTSPDGKLAAFVVFTKVTIMCWDRLSLATVVVDIARKRASLANTIGWRAYQKKDLTSALAGFREATSLDASYGLGWYNRAAVESRTGDVASARTSLDAARTIDPSFEARACRDADFTSLRASLTCPPAR